MDLINIQRIACLDDSVSPNFLWKQYTFYSKSETTEKYCQNYQPHLQKILNWSNLNISSENTVDLQQCLWQHNLTWYVVWDKWTDNWRLKYKNLNAYFFSKITAKCENIFTV